MVGYVWIIADYKSGRRLNVVDSREKAEYEVTRYRGLGFDPAYEKVVVR